MKFRTEISVASGDFKISHEWGIAMQGSCFTENMAYKMSNAGFSIDLNPFGITYNPLSLSHHLNLLIENKSYYMGDLFKDKEVYHSFAHHSRFSGTDPAMVLGGINSRVAQSAAFLKTANLLIISFGTAYVYRLQSTGCVVSNCHKLPAHYFTYNRLTVDEILGEWNDLIVGLKKINPTIRILFTVSPIRHWKDGAHENQLSKSILLLSVDALIKNHAGCYYFPAYEILLDDLRDYRFYSEDMLHPSSQAVDYIWEKFSETWFDKETLGKARESEKINRSLRHIPIIG